MFHQFEALIKYQKMSFIFAQKFHLQLFDTLTSTFATQFSVNAKYTENVKEKIVSKPFLYNNF